MNSIRKWLYRPKKSDTSLLAQFYFVDEDLNLVASELDSFDGRKDPERCTMLVNQLRVCQDKVLTVIQKIMDDAIPSNRANRDFRVKFPDDVLQDSLSGQLWFGAEQGLVSSNSREVESASMRPLARALTKNLDSLRNVLREQCLKSVNEYTERFFRMLLCSPDYHAVAVCSSALTKPWMVSCYQHYVPASRNVQILRLENDWIREALIIFDKLFAEFELSYVSAMVPVKTMKEYDLLQEVTVLFSETVQRALQVELLTQDMLDDYDPALMFTIPRLAIVCGLLVYPEGPLNPDMDPTNMTEMFRPFQTLLFKIRELLYTLNVDELSALEKSLCSSEEPEVSRTPLAGQGLESLQIDQGFDEEGEGIVSIDLLSSNILMHSSSGSPNTPVNTDTELSGLESLSPTSTINGSFRFSASSSGLNLVETMESFPSLNKSESQDSGLQSENISTSDTVTVDILPLVNQDQEGAVASAQIQSVNRNVNLKRSPDPNRKAGQGMNIERIAEHISEGDDKTATSSCDKPAQSNGEISATNSDLFIDKSNGVADNVEVQNFCRGLVSEVIENAVKEHTGATENYCDREGKDKQPDKLSRDPDVVTAETDRSETDLNSVIDPRETMGATGLSRQFSWQYNIQLASQNYNILENALSERSGDGGSISSDSTISDQSAQDSVTDFVAETLSTMSQPAKIALKRPSASSISERTNSDCTDDSKQRTSISNHSDKISSHNDQSSASDQSVASTRDSQNHPDINVSLTGNVATQILKSQLTNKSVKQKSKVKKDRRESLEHINCKTGPQASTSSEPLGLPILQTLRDADSVSSSYSSCQSASSESDCDKDCNYGESETSSCNSENNDEEEIALAIQAAELASRNEARSRFRSSSDLIHRLFVCIAGVADQLQTNYASDLRHILKCVFELNSTNMDEPEIEPESEPAITPTQNVVSTEIENISNIESRESSSSSSSTGNEQQGQSSDIQQTTSHSLNRQNSSPRRIFDEPPEWEPDDLVERCTSCKTPFTFVRRRHHCRNCGKIFCGKCSSTTVPLPQYGHQKPVRVCHKCFLYQIAHFTMQ